MTPDPSSSRPRPRPKPKNHLKKQPQRGLGVAQLEKLRLEEQSKHDAACLYQNHQLQLQHQHQDPHQQHKYQLQLLRHLPQPQLLNCGNANHDFLPLVAMASQNINVRRPGLPLLVASPQPLPVDENEPCLSSLSQVHDLCSPGSAVSVTISPTSSQQDQQIVVNDASIEAMSPRLVNSKPNTVYTSSLVPGHLQSELRRQNYCLQRECDDLYKKAKDSALALFPASCIISEKEMQGVGRGHNSQNERNLTTFTDLCLLHPSPGSLDLPPPSRNGLESLVVSSSSTGVPARELSSFQTFPLSPAWSTGDQVFNKKRPWVLTQGLSRKLESSKGVDLNASVEEIESDSTGQDSPGTHLLAPGGFSGTTLAFRDDGGYSSSPLLNRLISSSLTEDNARFSSPSTDSTPVPECLSAKMYTVSSAYKTGYSNTWASGAHFLSIRKGRLDYGTSCNEEAKPCGEFLTLGPSSQSTRKHRNATFWTGTYSCGFPSSEMGKVTSSNESAVIWQQAKNVGKLLPMVSRVANSDVETTTADDVHSDHTCTPVQINVEFSACLAQKKVAGQLLHNASKDSSLDLELRLSL